jgi:hypothetical protein
VVELRIRIRFFVFLKAMLQIRWYIELDLVESLNLSVTLKQVELEVLHGRRSRIKGRSEADFFLL